MDKLLVDIEEILTAASSQAFPKYKNPLTPVQIRVARDYIKRVRQQIVAVLQNLQIPLPPPKFDSTHAIRVTLQFIEVAIEEVAPERLGGYGELPQTFTNILAGGLQEMKGIVRQLDSYLLQRPDADLNARVARLASSSGVADLFSLVAAIIDRNGLVEFRIALQQIVSKLETPVYEIAFFGRVSAGKSSLLNRIIGTDLLPTGVTPVTAVPTRIRNRSEPSLLVWTAEGHIDRAGIEQLPEFVTEDRNAANHKRVTRLVAEVPVAILPDEVMLVDTPGLGSLALEGAAETLAYLPQCDLGVVLVEASSNLHSDDVATLDMLRAAAIPSAVVLSKADLIQPEDVERLVRYTEQQLLQQLGIPVSVTPLSSRAENAAGLKTWLDKEIKPRLSDARWLGEESDYRKAVALANRVLHALQVSLPTTLSGTPHGELPEKIGAEKAEAQLREAAALLDHANEQYFRLTTDLRKSAPDAVAMLVDRAFAHWEKTKGIEPLDAKWNRTFVNGIAQKGSEELALSMVSLARKLSDALNSASLLIAAGESGERVSLESFVKELPVPEFGGCSIQLLRPRLLSLSETLARRSVARRIESECERVLASFFSTYARGLELWFRTVLINLEREFNAGAEMYRAQLHRMKTPDATARSAENDVLDDIARLERALKATSRRGEAESSVSV